MLVFETNKQYIILACEEHVSIYLCFSVRLAPPLRFRGTHAHAAPCGTPVGSASVKMPSVLAPSDPPWRLSTHHALLIYQRLAHGDDAN